MQHRIIAGIVVLLTAPLLSVSASASHPADKAVARQQQEYQEARGGCGSKGGPGYRKANGKCAGWRG